MCVSSTDRTLKASLNNLVLIPGPGGATQSRKGYQLRSNLSGAVAVASQDGYKKGAVQS